jgi:uncharacterized repeat protein (TIGR03803 family)
VRRFGPSLGRRRAAGQGEIILANEDVLTADDLNAMAEDVLQPRMRGTVSAGFKISGKALATSHFKRNVRTELTRMESPFKKLRAEKMNCTGTRPVLGLLLAAMLALPAFVAQAGALFTSLYSFTGANDGNQPFAGLVQGSDGYFYGTTYYGGTNGMGNVFRISASGVLTNLYSFTGSNDGANPCAGLVQGRDGCFYGTTEYGGTNGSGAVFRITTKGALTNLHSFGGDDGANPYASLVQGADGYFYGTTYWGGTNGLGNVFRMSANGVLTNLYSFHSYDGALPIAGLVQGRDGYFYGTTEFGNTIDGDEGSVFRISTNGVLTNLYFFAIGGDDGYEPWSGLVQGSDGCFYGTTEQGGPSGIGWGTAFKIDTNGNLSTIYSFNDGRDGGALVAGLVQGSDGLFYGTTCDGGSYGQYNGTVFSVSANGGLTSMYSFTGGDDGGNPKAGLVQGGDGNFYGTTQTGGTYGYGTVFRLTVLPEFLALTLTYSMLNLTWSTEAGGLYQLQYNSDLSSSNWINLGSPITGTGPAFSTNDSIMNGSQRFYRVVLSP